MRNPSFNKQFNRQKEEKAQQIIRRFHRRNPHRRRRHCGGGTRRRSLRSRHHHPCGTRFIFADLWCSHADVRSTSSYSYLQI
ncbi:hypothetical protein HanRHA438_Chr11g0512401 [Helianthus annuus]|nr:hypothetical protein HanRHA438_Chr11g0512401 [Helianthus annuus]